MLLSGVQVGNRVEIYHHQMGMESKVYNSQVEDILSNNQLLLHTPISQGIFVRLPQKMRVGLLFISDKAMIKFDANVLGYDKEDDLDFTIMEVISEGERIQRRAFFRFNCLLPLKFRLDDADRPDLDFEDGVIKDIGGGGLRYVTNAVLGEGDMVSMAIMLGDELVMLKGRVINRATFEKSVMKYQYRVQFEGIDKGDQETIVKYIFNEERKLRKRERN